MADSTTRTATTSKSSDPSVIFEIWRSMQLVWRLMLDERVPALTKLIVPLVALYIISPIDLIPEGLLLFVGAIDDIALLFFGTKFFIALCPPDVVEEHRRALGSGREFTDDEYVDGTYRVVDEDK
ncbi:MAG: DUF1232 domain-containing protein [Chloroflexi bacterium]|nr:DUF1232 domain-containing protein [Chloroflexota bacterium]